MKDRAVTTLSQDMIDTIIYKIIHDFRGTVRALQELPVWIIEDMEAAGVEPPIDAKHSLHLVRENATRLNTMLDRLVAYSKVSRGQHQKVDLKEALTDALAQIPVPQDSRIRCVFNPQTITTDCADVATILQYLIHNAFVHNTRPTRVAVLGSVVGDTFELYIRDNGTGIPPDKMDQVFHPMVSHSNNSKDGCGMGLAIVERITRICGGTVTALPPKRSHHGATLKIVLPVMTRQ